MNGKSGNWGYGRSDDEIKRAQKKQYAQWMSSLRRGPPGRRSR